MKRRRYEVKQVSYKHKNQRRKHLAGEEGRGVLDRRDVLDIMHNRSRMTIGGDGGGRKNIPGVARGCLDTIPGVFAISGERAPRELRAQADC